MGLVHVGATLQALAAANLNRLYNTSFARPALSNTGYDLAAKIIVFKLCYRPVPLVAKWPSASGTL
jgi:hypothetical protein